MFQLAIPAFVDSVSLASCQHTRCCDSQSPFSLGLTYTCFNRSMIYLQCMYVIVNMDHHQQIPSVYDSISYTPSFSTITTIHHTTHSQYSPLSMWHHHQYSATKHHDVYILRSTVARFADPLLMVSG